MPNEERKYHSVKRSKKSSFVKGTGTSGAPHWRPDFRNKEVTVKPKLVIHDVKTRFPSLFASTSLGTKTIKITSNKSPFSNGLLPRIVILKTVSRFVVSLLSTFSGLSIFCRGFFLCFWQLCLLLCCPPKRSLSDRDKTVREGTFFLGGGEGWGILVFFPKESVGPPSCFD